MHDYIIVLHDQTQYLKIISDPHNILAYRAFCITYQKVNKMFVTKETHEIRKRHIPVVK